MYPARDIHIQSKYTPWTHRGVPCRRYTHKMSLYTMKTSKDQETTGLREISPSRVKLSFREHVFSIQYSIQQ